MNNRLTKSILLAIAMLLPWGNIMAAEDVRVPENRVIYEVFVRNFSPEGNFKGVEAQIPRLKELGVDVIWLMPIYKLGEVGLWGTYSSPYAIKDYKAIDPANGSAEDLRSLIATIHNHGMEIWFDWVGNHTSKDNVWVYQHPEYYGNNFYSPNGWSDVYQLDVNNAAMHEAMIDAMQYWVTEFDIDGYRCDYASGPTEEFWRKATSRVLKNGKRIAWLAEDDSKPQLVSNGYFDYNYAWAFHDRLLDQVRGINLNNLRNECANLSNDATYNGRSRMVYLSNHDVVQDKGGTEDRLFGQYLKPMTVLQFTVYGMPLIYNGQEIQYKSGSVVLAEKTPINWSNPDTSMTELIKTLCHLKHTQPALRTGNQKGAYSNLSTSNDNNIMAYRRSYNGSNVIVALNYSNSQQSFTFNSSLPEGNYKDVFSGKVVNFSNPGTQTLPALGYAVYISTDESAGGGETGGNEEVTPPTPSNPATIYISNNTGWNPAYLYGYANNADCGFGSWPGLSKSSTKTINNIEYQAYTVSYTGTCNLIFNNGSGQLGDVVLTIEAGKEYYYNATPDAMTAVNPNEVGTEKPEEPQPEPEVGNITIIGDYNLAYNGEKENLHYWGGPESTWPGVKMATAIASDGKTYKVFKVPAGTTNVIFNTNGDSNKTADLDYYDSFVMNDNGATSITVTFQTEEKPEEPEPEVEEITINGNYNLAYCGDKENLHYWGGAESTWPGVKMATAIASDGKTYKVFKVPAGTTNVIFNTNGDSNKTADLDYYDSFVMDDNGATSIAVTFNPEERPQNPNVATIYIANNTGWGSTALYAYGDGEIFGRWPGLISISTQNVDGIEYQVFTTEATGHYNLIFNNNNRGAQLHDISVVLERGKEYFFNATSNGISAKVYANDFVSNVEDIELESNDAEVKYYNLQGVRVFNPQSGIYIERRGSKVRKVVL